MDFIFNRTVLTFQPGETNKTVRVTILDDLLVEGTEDIQLALSNNTGGALLGSTNLATLQIIDNDVAFTFTATNLFVSEDATNAVITVIRYGDTNVTASVTYATSDGTAVHGTNYLGSTNTLNYALGQTTNGFLIPITDDLLVQPDKTVNLRLFNPSPTNIAGLGTNGTATLFIVGNDSIFDFSAPTYSVSESGGARIINVLRGGQNQSTVSVAYATADITAIAPLDYTAQSATLFFAPGQSNLSFTVNINPDTLAEGTRPSACCCSTRFRPTPAPWARPTRRSSPSRTTTSAWRSS